MPMGNLHRNVFINWALLFYANFALSLPVFWPTVINAGQWWT
jgi:hypothetical protein